jgi:serine/threonine-protein kinase
MPGDLVGQSLSHFRIVEKLGEGGMGVVYKATDEKLGRAVALKVLPEHFAESQERRQRFLREARSAAAVTHANIATVYEVGEADGHVFIAMEFIKGRSLREVLAERLPVPEALRIAKSIVRGLAAAHENGVVHRDLKPENVMVTPKGDVKILDFGLAKLHETHTPSVLAEARTEQQITEEGRVLGTPAYMSPEQARGETVDARSDVFSFGVMLYEMLAGVRPFQGGTAIAILMAVTTKEPEPVAALNPEVTPEVSGVVERCLKKLPDARYANGQDVVEALGALVSEPSGSIGQRSGLRGRRGSKESGERRGSSEALPNFRPIDNFSGRAKRRGSR